MKGVLIFGIVVAVAISGAVLLQPDAESVVDEIVEADDTAANPFASRQGATLREDAAPARTGAYRDDFAALNAQREDVITLPSGVQYEVIRPGNGEVAGLGSTVKIFYEGSLTDGNVFDSTVDDAEPRTVVVDTIAVPGFKEAISLMDAGAHWRVVIPPSQGFGRIGNNKLRRRDLIYDIRMVSVEG